MGKSKEIKVLIKEPGKAAKVTTISNDLETLQKIVGGYVERVKIANNFSVLCDEDGKAKEKPFNIRLFGFDFVGPIILCGEKGAEFASFPLTWHKAKQMMPRLWEGE